MFRPQAGKLDELSQRLFNQLNPPLHDGTVILPGNTGESGMRHKVPSVDSTEDDVAKKQLDALEAINGAIGALGDSFQKLSERVAALEKAAAKQPQTKP
jgi:hypothetical protein